MEINNAACLNCSIIFRNTSICPQCNNADSLHFFEAVHYISPLPLSNRKQSFSNTTNGGITLQGCTFYNVRTAIDISGCSLTSINDKFIACGQVVKSDNQAKVKLHSPTIID